MNPQSPENFDKLLDQASKQGSGALSVPDIIQSANMLVALGITPENPVALFLPEIPDTQTALWASCIAGIGFPIHPGLSDEQTGNLLRETRASTLITLGPYPDMDIWDRVEEIRPYLPDLRTILQIDLVENLSRLKKFGTRFSLRTKGKAEKIPGQQLGDFHRTRQKFDSSALSFPQPQPEGPSLILHSAGTMAEIRLKSFSLQEFMKNPDPDALRQLYLPETSPLTTLRTGDTDIDLSETASIIRQIPQVEEVVIIPSPDLNKGWVPIAYLTTHAPVSPREIYDYAVSQMPAEAMVPQGIRLVDHLPRGIDGKVHYYQLTCDEIRTEIQRLIGKETGEQETEVGVSRKYEGDWKAAIGMSAAEAGPALSEKLQTLPVEIEWA